MIIVLALCVWSTTRGAQELPIGFADVNVGSAWTEVTGTHEFTDLTTAIQTWDEHVQACGYRLASTSIDDGTLIVTVNDFVVTDVSYTTPIEPGSDLFSVADLVMQTYGQPTAATTADALGRVTIDKDRVHYISLHYTAPRDVTFTISGQPLWEYQIRVQLERYRWHENKTMRCARAKEAETRAQAALPGESADQPSDPETE